MPKNTTIKKGCRLSVTSWENDGDLYQTSIQDGLTMECVKFFIEFSQLFKSHCSNQNSFGNMYEPSDEEIEMMTNEAIKICEKYNIASTNYLISFDLDLTIFDGGVVGTLISQLLGCSEVYFTRVYASHKVELIPEDILIEDVTNSI